jgi:hypothetical protein
MSGKSSGKEIIIYIRLYCGKDMILSKNNTEPSKFYPASHKAAKPELSSLPYNYFAIPCGDILNFGEEGIHPICLCL